MQKKFSFDPETVRKIKHSLLISMAGFILTISTLIMNDPNTTAFLAAHPALALAVGSLSTFVVNFVKEFISGE